MLAVGTGTTRASSHDMYNLTDVQRLVGRIDKELQVTASVVVVVIQHWTTSSRTTERQGGFGWQALHYDTLFLCCHGYTSFKSWSIYASYVDWSCTYGIEIQAKKHKDWFTVWEMTFRASLHNSSARLAVLCPAIADR